MHDFADGWCCLRRAIERHDEKTVVQLNRLDASDVPAAPSLSEQAAAHTGVSRARIEQYSDRQYLFEFNPADEGRRLVAREPPSRCCVLRCVLWAT